MNQTAMYLQTCMLALAVATTPGTALFSTTSARASELDRFDLNSITLQPAYISPTLLRQSSCLRAVAVSPPPRTPTSPGSRVAIAVGDAGAILRSDDAGQSWRAVENIQPLVTPTSTPFGRSPRRTKELSPIPFCHFTDVLWASPVDVIVVGGGYEPVTGISRGVCVLSRDGGRTWHMGDAHELPRLRKLRMGGPTSQNTSQNTSQTTSQVVSQDRTERELAPGVLEAIGDPSEASGVDRFHSYDGGQTWVEDIRVTSAPETTQQAAGRTDVAGQTFVIQTPARRVTANGLSRPGDGWQFAVASHGRIWRRSEPNSAWQAVRGQGRSVAVLFVAASPAAVPWSLAGRESLHENRRTAILLDIDGNDENIENDLMRCRAAAAMLGISDVHCVTNDGERTAWLSEHRPAVAVFDESLTPATQLAWSALVEQARTRPFSQSQSSAVSDWNGPVRTILTRRVTASKEGGEPTMAWYDNNSDPRWQRAWNHASVLRGNALLSGPGVLANDLAIDALMLAAPQQPTAAGVEVATFDDTSGSVRRDISLAAGLALKDGQNREPAETLTASNRRLQITTARMNQTQRLHDELFQQSSGRRSAADQTRLRDKMNQLLAVTAAEDRTRLLWDAMSVTMTAEQESAQVRELLLSLLSRHGQPAALRRWAELNVETLQSSVERRSLTSLDQLTDRRGYPSSVLGNVADNLQLTTGQIAVPDPDAAASGRGSQRGQPISPFQISPVSYEAETTPSAPLPLARGTAPHRGTALEYEPSQRPGAQSPGLETSGMLASRRTAPSIILVPETEPVEWQPTRGWTTLATPPQASMGAETLKPAASDADDEPARINWDYHPVVMAARGITPQNHAMGLPNAGPALTGPASGSDSTRKATTYVPPKTVERPLLDGLADDACWTTADRWRGEKYEARCTADEEYLYFAVAATNTAGLRLSLDCDGDYFTALRFEVSSDGARRVSVDQAATIFPVWYSATAPHTSTASADNEDGWLAEIAIARSSLPAAVCRVRVCPDSPQARSQWEVMPTASQWYPTH